MDPILVNDPNGRIHAIFYLYTPSKEAGYAFLALFALGTIGHAILPFPLGSRFTIPMIIGGISQFSPP
jgi:hypothetical protein